MSRWGARVTGPPPLRQETHMAMYGKSGAKKPTKSTPARSNAGGAVRGLDRARAVGGRAYGAGGKKPKPAR